MAAFAANLGEQAQPIKGAMSKSKPQGARPPEGYLFLCTSKTEQEALAGFFGLAGEKWPVIRNVKPGTHLFLLNIQTRVLHGCFEAASRPGYNLNPRAFGGTHKGSPFPCQVKTRRWLDAPPLEEADYKDLLLGRPLVGDAKRSYYDLKIPKVKPLEERFMACSEAENRRLGMPKIAASTGTRSSWHEPQPEWIPDDHHHSMLDPHDPPDAGAYHCDHEYWPVDGLPGEYAPGEQPLDWRDYPDVEFRDCFEGRGAAPYDTPSPDWQLGPSALSMVDQPEFGTVSIPFSSEPLDWHADEYARSISFPANPPFRGASMNSSYLSPSMPLGSSEQEFSRYQDHPQSRRGHSLDQRSTWDLNPQPGRDARVGDRDRAPGQHQTAELRMPATFWKELEDTGRDPPFGQDQHHLAGPSNAHRQQGPGSHCGATRQQSGHHGSQLRQHDNRAATTLQLLCIDAYEPAKNVLRAIQAALGTETRWSPIDFLLVRRAHHGQEAIVNLPSAPGGKPHSAVSLLVERMHGSSLEAFLHPTRNQRAVAKPLVARYCGTQGLEALAERFATTAVCCWAKADKHNVSSEKPTFFALPKSGQLSPALQKLRDKGCQTSAALSAHSSKHDTATHTAKSHSWTQRATKNSMPAAASQSLADEPAGRQQRSESQGQQAASTQGVRVAHAAKSTANDAGKLSGQQPSEAEPAGASVKRKREADAGRAQGEPASMAARKPNAQPDLLAGKQPQSQQSQANSFSKRAKTDGSSSAQQTPLPQLQDEPPASDATDGNKQDSGEKRRGGQRIEFQMPAAKSEATQARAGSTGGVLGMTLEQSIANRKGQAGAQPPAAMISTKPTASQLQPACEKSSRGRQLPGSGGLRASETRAPRATETGTADVSTAGSENVQKAQMAESGHDISKHRPGAASQGSTKVLVIDRRNGDVQHKVPRRSSANVAKAIASGAGSKRPLEELGDAAQQQTAHEAPARSRAKSAAAPAPDRAPTPATPLLNDVAAKQERVAKNAGSAAKVPAECPSMRLTSHRAPVSQPPQDVNVLDQHPAAASGPVDARSSKVQGAGMSKATMQKGRASQIGGRLAHAKQSQAGRAVCATGRPFGFSSASAAGPPSQAPAAVSSAPPHRPLAASCSIPAGRSSKLVPGSPAPQQRSLRPTAAGAHKPAKKCSSSLAIKSDPVRQQRSLRPTAAEACTPANNRSSSSGINSDPVRGDRPPEAQGSRRSLADGTEAHSLVQQEVQEKPNGDALAAAMAELEAQEAKVRALKAEAELKTLRARVRALEAQQQAQSASPSMDPSADIDPSAAPPGTSASLSSGSSQQRAMVQHDQPGLDVPQELAKGIRGAEQASDSSMRAALQGDAMELEHGKQASLTDPSVDAAVRVAGLHSAGRETSDPAIQAECFLSSLAASSQLGSSSTPPANLPLQQASGPELLTSTTSVHVAPEAMVSDIADSGGPAVVTCHVPISEPAQGCNATNMNGQEPVSQMAAPTFLSKIANEKLPKPTVAEAVAVSTRVSRPGADGVIELDGASSPMKAGVFPGCSSPQNRAADGQAAAADILTKPLPGDHPADSTSASAVVAEDSTMQSHPGPLLAATSLKSGLLQQQPISALPDRNMVSSSRLHQSCKGTQVVQPGDSEQLSSEAMEADAPPQQEADEGIEQQPVTVLEVGVSSQQEVDHSIEQAADAAKETDVGLPSAAGPGDAEWVIDASDFDGDEAGPPVDPDLAQEQEDLIDNDGDLDIGG
ncbi:hypothetical protein WJX74_009305 [Apatococcus lobatus]|uniref:DCD domain-containing protein n=1 Tax=Apatococcus lobatus TaxID=904363 RepID=A0AAW1RQ25_9CHLO